jgi:hypothetical protein
MAQGYLNLYEKMLAEQGHTIAESFNRTPVGEGSTIT